MNCADTIAGALANHVQRQSCDGAEVVEEQIECQSVLDHGGTLQTFYGHMSAIYVREGQRVRGGLVLGAMGSTGRSTGNHCHFEVRVDGKAVNPRRFLSNDPELIQSAASPPNPIAAIIAAAAPRKTRLLRVGAEAIDRSRHADASAVVGP